LVQFLFLPLAHGFPIFLIVHELALASFSGRTYVQLACLSETTPDSPTHNAVPPAFCSRIGHIVVSPPQLFFAFFPQLAQAAIQSDNAMAPRFR
jgi:hypothetical protein